MKKKSNEVASFKVQEIPYDNCLTDAEVASTYFAIQKREDLLQDHLCHKITQN